MVDTSRIDELKRRVQRDPASIAFAQLAEEFRRAGQFQEAVDTCRAGLVTHPGYLSAHVTLGRALLDLGRLQDARTELMLVLQAAPEHLAATRALAEVHRQSGEYAEARRYYDAALRLAPNDPEIERVRARLSDGPAAPLDVPAPSGAVPVGRRRSRAAATITALEGWLEAIDATRAQRRA